MVEEERHRSFNGMTSPWENLPGPMEEMPEHMLLPMERNPSDSSFNTRYWGYMPTSYEWVSLLTLSRLEALNCQVFCDRFR